jgi:autotransporter-associated beta strand protein
MTHNGTITGSVAAALLTLAAFLAVALGVSEASAATVTWFGGSGPCGFSGPQWSSGICWNGTAGPAPTTGDDAVLGNAFPPANNYDLIGVQLHSVTFGPNDFVSPYNFSGNVIGLQSSGSITDNNNTGGPEAINTGITLNGPATFTLSAGAVGLSFGVNPITGTTGAGSLTLVNNSTGALILSAANTYTGATAVNAGTVTVTGLIVSPVTVNSGGTLGGTGTITNTVTVNSGGALAPGLSTGIINTGDLALTAGSTLAIEINGATVGTQYDQVNVTGTVNLGGATLSVTLGFVPAAGTVFTIVNNDAADAVTGTFAGLPEGATFTVVGTQFRISYVGSNDVTLTADGTQAIPTLSEWAQLGMVALLLGGGLLALRRRSLRLRPS